MIEINPYFAILGADPSVFQSLPDPEIDVGLAQSPLNLGKEEELEDRAENRKQTKKKDPWKDHIHNHINGVRG